MTNDDESSPLLVVVAAIRHQSIVRQLSALHLAIAKVADGSPRQR